MIPRKYAPVLFGLILSGLMSLLVSGLSTLRAVGPVPGFAGLWAGAWLVAWPIAFGGLAGGTVARRAVDRLTADR